MHLGIDIGGTSVKAALLDERGRASMATSAPYSRPDTPALVEAIRRACRELTPGSSLAGLRGVGLAVPGLLDASGGEVTASANVPGLVGMPLRDLLGEATGQVLPLPRCFTDAHASAIDLVRTESPRPVGRLAALSIGTGVGMCVLDDERPLLVSGRSSGHVGQMDVTIDERDREPPVGPDGGRGGLEAYIGLPALVARLGCTPETLRTKLEQDRVPLLALARALRVVHAIYRPQHIRLLGGVGNQMAPFLPYLKSEISRNLTSLSRPEWTLECGTTTFHAAMGAARGAQGAASP